MEERRTGLPPSSVATRKKIRRPVGYHVYRRRLSLAVGGRRVRMPRASAVGVASRPARTPADATVR